MNDLQRTSEILKRVDAEVADLQQRLKDGISTESEDRAARAVAKRMVRDIKEAQGTLARALETLRTAGSADPEKQRNDDHLDKREARPPDRDPAR